ncbi:MAG TPA: hypothetical protein VG713_00200, partial [Pirellulales bacterium]|nr:hypothetical protein [Pirellulales bacterium]
MLERLLIPDIRELIAEGDFTTLGEVLNQWLPADIAALLAELPRDEQAQIFRILNSERRAKAFEYLALETQEYLLRVLPEAEGADLLNRMAPDDRTALLEEVPKELSTRMFALLSPDQRRIAESLLRYDRDSVGRLMTPDYVAVGKDWSI